METDQSGVGNALSGVPSQDGLTGQAGGTVTAGSAIVSPAPCIAVGTEMSMPRRRYQRGRLISRGKRRKVWIGMFREDRVMPDGTLHRVRRSVVLGTVKHSTKLEAIQTFQPYLDAVNLTAIPKAQAGRTLAKLVAEWESKVAPTLKPTTARQARSHLRTHILPTFGEMSLHSINTRNVQAFVADLTVKGLSSVSIGHIVRTLHKILSTAKGWRYVPEVFECKALSMPDAGEKKEEPFFTAEQARRIIEGSAEPYATLWATLALTGIRAGELLGLKVTDIDFDKKLISIRRTLDHATRTMLKPKSKSSAATLHMPEALEKRLQAFLAKHWRQNDMGLLFCNSKGKPMQRDKVAYKLQATLRELGIEKAGLHAFRHMVASELLENGASPVVWMRQMRHSDPRVALKQYGHIIGNAQKDAVNSLAGGILG